MTSHLASLNVAFELQASRVRASLLQQRDDLPAVSPVRPLRSKDVPASTPCDPYTRCGCGRMKSVRYFRCGACRAAGRSLRRNHEAA